MPHDLQASLAAYRPSNEQEQHDLPLLLAALKQPGSFTRQNETAHFTASAWVVNPASSTHRRFLTGPPEISLKFSSS